MNHLQVIVISWNRSHFLRRTLDSIFQQIGELSAGVFVVDNGSDASTLNLIRDETRLSGFELLQRNLGINGALEAFLPADLESRTRYVLISDADVEYREPLSLVTGFLETHPEIGAVSLQHSPEHPESERIEWSNRTWLLKESERGCALLLRSTDLQTVRPLPVDNLKDFDWWVVRDAPASLAKRGQKIAVLPGGALHLGWRRGASTWQSIETPEFDEYKE